MKQLQLTSFIIALLAMIGGSGCSSDDNPVAKLTYAETPEAFNYIVTSGARATGVALDGVKYSMLFDDEARTATLTIYDLRLDENDSPATYVFNDVPWEFSVGTPTVERVMEAESLVPEFGDSEPHSFTDLKVVFYESSELDPSDCRGFSVRFTVDGIYKGRAYPMRMLCRGTTEVFPSEEEAAAGIEDVYVTYAPQLMIEFNPDRFTAKVVVSDMELSAGSEVLGRVVIPDAKLCFDEQGGYSVAYDGTVDAGTWSLSGFKAVEEDSGDLFVTYTAAADGRTHDIRSFMQSNRYSTPTADAGPVK